MSTQRHRLCETHHGLTVCNNSDGVHTLDDVQSRLLNDWQRDLPLVARPFQVMAEALRVNVGFVLNQLSAFCADGTVSRVGPVFRPNSIGASTLVAVAVPSDELEAVATLINEFDEVNHNYEREHAFNLWFVATAPDQFELRQALDRMEMCVGRDLLRLPLLKDYHIDLGFDLSKHASSTRTTEAKEALAAAASAVPSTGNQSCTSPLSPQAMEAMLAHVQCGLPLVERPYQVVAARVGCTEAQVIDSLSNLLAQGIIKRLGVVVRHHELGYRSNAMVVWNVPDAEVDALGQAMGAETEVTLCYQRPRVPGCWPYNLFCMIHGQDRETVLQLVHSLAERHGLKEIPHQVLFSGRRFKQRGAHYRKHVAGSNAPHANVRAVSHG